MLQYQGFEWDEGNQEHATRHGITREEIEHALAGGFVEAEPYDRNEEKRYLTMARSPKKGVLAIVVTMRGNRLRVITAYRLKGARAKRYEKEI